MKVSLLETDTRDGEGSEQDCPEILGQRRIPCLPIYILIGSCLVIVKGLVVK